MPGGPRSTFCRGDINRAMYNHDSYLRGAGRRGPARSSDRSAVKRIWVDGARTDSLESAPRQPERCRSGRTGRFRKPVYPSGYPGFESLPLRQEIRRVAGHRLRGSSLEVSRLQRPFPLATGRPWQILPEFLCASVPPRDSLARRRQERKVQAITLRAQRGACHREGSRASPFAAPSRARGRRSPRCAAGAVLSSVAAGRGRPRR